jgi:hypothetical protein
MTYHNELMNKANKLADGIVTFTNSSWHNDACGSIMFELPEHDDFYVMLYAFETEYEMKAEHFEDMFMVQAVEGGDFNEATILFTNDENEAITHAVKLAKEMQDDQDIKDYEAECSKGFEWEGVWIEDRTKSPCGRFDLSPEQSEALYGLDC